MRIIRALEVLYLTGVPISRHQQAHAFDDTPYKVLKIGLMRDRSELYQRIEERVEQMIEEGLREEVQSVLARGYASSLKPLQSIGYKQMAAFIEGHLILGRSCARDETRHQALCQTAIDLVSP